MRKTKSALIVATALVLIGCILFAGVMTRLGWDFTKLSTTQYETNTHEVEVAFDGISIDTDTADIVFASSDDGSCRVVCYEEERARHTVAVEDGILSITGTDERSVHGVIGHIGINFSSPKITVYLPQTEYAVLHIEESTGDVEIRNDFTFRDVDIMCSTGDIRVEHISADSLMLSVSTGHVSVQNVICAGDVTVTVSTGRTELAGIACESLTSDGDTGDITLKNVIAAGMFSIERSTGDVKFDACDAAEIFVETDTGDVTGTLLTDKVFIAETDTGHVDVPKTIVGGRCEVTTDTGDIELGIFDVKSDIT